MSHCSVCKGIGHIELLDTPCQFCNGTGEYTKAADAFLTSHTCQCILLDRKKCPVCGKNCHHDTPNRVKIVAPPV
ncbi:MAG: hypothetical protein K8823_745 [Cenarchaeum symbiont of Oopsacas minuta]|nr:hypothetical protein [Cenarchaeum symbiont of Oopsacas minuta]